MPKISISGDTSIAALQAAIDVLRSQERKWRKTSSRRCLIVYLASAYRLYEAWIHRDCEKLATRRLAKLAKLGEGFGRHAIRTIIDATSSADRRSKSRWTQALRYAYRKRKRWGSFKRFMRDNGGIAGCAGKWADLHAYRRAPKGYVPFGSESFPKVRFP